MKRFGKITRLVPVAITFAVASAYAATVDNPGAIDFSANSDSKVQPSGGKPSIWTNLLGDELFDGTVDSAGVTSFDQASITFDPATDTSGYTGQVQATSAGTGTYCPNSGAATIAFSARIKFTKVANTSISTTPCYIRIQSTGGSNTFTLTTGTSGSFTGGTFKSGSPAFVAAIKLSSTIEGASCPSWAATDLQTHYGLPDTGAEFLLPGASITPTNFTGTGC